MRSPRPIADFVIRENDQDIDPDQIKKVVRAVVDGKTMHPKQAT